MCRLSSLVVLALLLHTGAVCEDPCDRRSVSGIEGGDVTLQVDHTGIRSIRWSYFQNGTLIITTNRVNKPYRGRVSSTDTGSLHITGLTQDDQRIYTADIRTDRGRKCLIFDVTVYGQLSTSDIQMSPNATSDETCSMILTCTVTGNGRDVTITWSSVTSSNITVTGDVLCVPPSDVNVTYTCTASNPISNVSKDVIPQEIRVGGYDCSDIWGKNKASTNGIYSIKPEGADYAFPVFCEMTANGGWTVIQKHNGEDRLSFDKMWADYEHGFGKLTGEHWLGLRQMYLLTNQKHRPSTLRISLGDFLGDEAYAEYRPFSVGDQSDFYRLSLGKYSGTAGDAFLGYPELAKTNQYGSFFSTEDKPHDGCHPFCRVGDIIYPSCSFQKQSGWWFNECGLANLNGEWHSPPNLKLWASSVSWSTWKRYESLKYSIMYLIH